MDGRGVSVEEARWLLMCLQKFYDFEGHGVGVGSKGDQEFKLEELVDEAERVS
jgi:ATP synthase F1 complex assembly factor 1